MKPFVKPLLFALGGGKPSGDKRIVDNWGTNNTAAPDGWKALTEYSGNEMFRCLVDEYIANEDYPRWQSSACPTWGKIQRSDGGSFRIARYTAQCWQENGGFPERLCTSWRLWVGMDLDPTTDSEWKNKATLIDEKIDYWVPGDHKKILEEEKLKAYPWGNTIIIELVKRYGGGSSYTTFGEIRFYGDTNYPQPPNIINAGATIDENNIASGFSSRNYVKANGYAFAPGSAPWEIGTHFKTGSSISGTQGLMGGCAAEDYKLPYFFIESNRLNFLLSSTGSYWNMGGHLGEPALEVEKEYWAKLVFDGTAYRSYLSEDGENYNLVVEYANAAPVWQGNRKFGIGNNLYSSYNQQPFGGQIWLSDTYIKIDGNEVWRGTPA